MNEDLHAFFCMNDTLLMSRHMELQFDCRTPPPGGRVSYDQEIGAIKCKVCFVGKSPILKRPFPKRDVRCS